jgi:hypothetical protein
MIADRCPTYLGEILHSTLPTVWELPLTLFQEISTLMWTTLSPLKLLHLVCRTRDNKSLNLSGGLGAATEIKFADRLAVSSGCSSYTPITLYPQST